MCMPSMPRPARSCGATTRSPIILRAGIRAATWSIAAWPLWKGKVYVASVDGRLHALDAATGKKIWEADTIVDHKLPYSSTGAPQIAGSVVVIGNSGADMGHTAVRGYISAYDLESGAAQVAFLHGSACGRPALRESGTGGGRQNLGSAPQAGIQRRRDGVGWLCLRCRSSTCCTSAPPMRRPTILRQLGPKQLDSLYAACIIALDATTGRMAWYYQETPHDSWDYDAVQKMVLADIAVDGATASVIMQASKNAFFYVLDRKTGKLLSAKNYAFMNWATHVDMKTGRPVTTTQSDWYNTAEDSRTPLGLAPIPGIRCHTARRRGWFTSPSSTYPAIWVDMLHNGSKVKYRRRVLHGAGHHSRRHLRCQRFRLACSAPCRTSKRSKPRAMSNRCEN